LPLPLLVVAPLFVIPEGNLLFALLLHFLFVIPEGNLLLPWPRWLPSPHQICFNPPYPSGEATR